MNTVTTVPVTVGQVLEQYNRAESFFSPKDPKFKFRRASTPSQESLRKLKELPPEMPVEVARRHLAEEYRSGNSSWLSPGNLSLFRKWHPVGAGILAAGVFLSILATGGLKFVENYLPVSPLEDRLTTIAFFTAGVSSLLGAVGLNRFNLFYLDDKDSTIRKTYGMLGAYLRHHHKANT